MRPSPKHRWTGLAITLSLGSALVLAATTALADASLLGEAVPTVTVKAGPLVTVQSSPTPTVEVPGVGSVQTPTLPQAQVPTPPPVTTPSLPTVGTPSTPSTPTTPVLPVVGRPRSAGEASSGSSSSGDTGAHAAAVSAAGSADSGGSTASAAGSANGHGAASSASSRRSSRPGTSARRAARETTAGVSQAGSPAVGATAVPAATAPVRSTAHPSAHSSGSSDPFDAIGRHIPFPVPVPDWSKPIILLLLLLAAWFAVRSRLAAVRARRLEGQRALLLRDLDAMQATLVPTIPGRVGDLSVSVAYRPADGPAAGGDFYDVLALPSGKVAIVLGDVAGHGREALTQAVLTRYTLRAYVQAGLEPRAALSLAGSVLAEPGEMRFATVVVALYDSVAGRLTYASAGHPPPIAIGFATPEPLTLCCSAPICCDLPTGRRQTTISVPTGGEMCFFSDGLLEARTSDGLLGRERLIGLVEDLVETERAPALLARVRDEALATPDDMVACVISCAVGAPAPGGRVEELEVDGESLAHADVAGFMRACAVPAADVAAALARLAVRVAEDGTALLRVDCARDGDGVATAAVLPGLAVSVPTPIAAAGGAGGVQERALALARASA